MRSPWLAVALALLGALTAACGGSDGARSRPSDPESSGVPGEATETPVEARGPRAGPIAAPPFLVDWTTGPGLLRPIDPATASDIPGFEPIEFHWAQASLSSDRKTLAALVWPNPSYPRASLRLVDLEAWSERTAQRPLTSPGLVWSVTGEVIYAFEWVGAGTSLVAFDRRTLVARDVMALNFRLARMPVAIPGTTDLVALGYRVSNRESDTPTGDAFLAFIDPVAARVTKELPLPGLMVGQWRDSDRESPSGYWPAVAVSPDGSRSYIAHAESESVTVVDLQTRAIAASKSPVRGKPWWRRLGSSLVRELVTTASAKGGGSSARMTAAVSPDGRVLYVAGQSDERCPDTPMHCVEGRPLGLRVIDTSDLHLIVPDSAVAQFALSDDGAFVVGTAIWRTLTWREQDGGFVATETLHDSGVRVYSAPSGEHLATLELPFPASFLQVVIAPGTRYALLGGQRSSETASPSRHALAVLDLDRLAFTAQRDFVGGGAAFIVPDSPSR